MNLQHDTRRRAADRKRIVAPPGSIETWGPYDIAGIGSRRVRLYVPRGDAERSVVVLFDGQNAFGDEDSFAGGWQADRAAERIVTKKRPAPIVVAIDHGGVDRIHELSPFRERGADGRLDALVGFLHDRLARDIGSRFSIPHDPARWVIGGSSMGGLAALYTHFAIPGLFGAALAMSPALWIAKRRIFAWVESRQRPRSSRIYIDCGVGEDRGSLLQLTNSMERLLRRRGYGDDSLRIRRDARGTHSEASWRRRLPGAFRFLLR
ncbi:MAG: alpha/beta hydrolase-fold protein [Thermoanaerobaculia bacterium]|jgi:predicted alpha/beta superfamily hydrolase